MRGELVSFITRYDWPDHQLTSESTLRFVGKRTLEAQLLSAGFR